MGHQRCPQAHKGHPIARGVARPEVQRCRAHTPGSSPLYAYRLSVTNSIGRTEQPLGRRDTASRAPVGTLEGGTLWFGKCLLVLVLVCYNVGIAPKWACVHRKNTSTAKHPSKHPGLFPRAFLSRFLPEPPAPQQSDRHFGDHRAAASALPRIPGPVPLPDVLDLLLRPLLLLELLFLQVVLLQVDLPGQEGRPLRSSLACSLSGRGASDPPGPRREGGRSPSMPNPSGLAAVREPGRTACPSPTLSFRMLRGATPNPSCTTDMALGMREDSLLNCLYPLGRDLQHDPLDERCRWLRMKGGSEGACPGTSRSGHGAGTSRSGPCAPAPAGRCSCGGVGSTGYPRHGPTQAGLCCFVSLPEYAP